MRGVCVRFVGAFTLCCGIGHNRWLGLPQTEYIGGLRAAVWQALGLASSARMYTSAASHVAPNAPPPRAYSMWHADRAKTLVKAATGSGALGWLKAGVLDSVPMQVCRGSGSQGAVGHRSKPNAPLSRGVTLLCHIMPCNHTACIALHAATPGWLCFDITPLPHALIRVLPPPHCCTATCTAAGRCGPPAPAVRLHHQPAHHGLHQHPCGQVSVVSGLHLCLLTARSETCRDFRDF